MRDPNETVHVYEYDLLGRQTQDRVVAFGDDIDQSVKRIATGYEVRGMVATVTSFDQSGVGVGNVVNQVAYEYDDFGQLSKDSQSHSGAADGSTPAVSYTYEDGSTGNTARRTSTVYPNGRIVETLYGSTGSDNDKLSRVEALKIQGEGQNAASYEYLGLGWYVNVLYPEPSVNLTYIKAASQHVGDAGDPYTGYDRFGRTVEMLWETTPGEAERDHFVWGYDRASNRTWKANLAASSGQDEHYGYDELYQVTEADRGNLNFNLTAIGAIPDNTQTFTYDPTGNWDRFTNADDGTETLDQSRVHNQDNQITQIDGSNSGILYDRAGNATQMPPDKNGDWSKFYRLKWDAWNRLVEVKDVDEAVVAVYAYDGTTRRTTKTVNGTTTHFYYNDQWRPVEERQDASTNAERQYLWGNRYRDDLVLRDRDTTANGTLDERLYVTHDYFNPTAIVDTSGAVQERYGYSAFGVRRIMRADFSVRATSSFDWELGFQGQFLDLETEYYDYGFRYYSPQIGRWINRDPIEESGGESLYRFVDNSSISGLDFLGLAFEDGPYSDKYKAIQIAADKVSRETDRTVDLGLQTRDDEIRSGDWGVRTKVGLRGKYYARYARGNDSGFTDYREHIGVETAIIIDCRYDGYYLRELVEGALPDDIETREGHQGGVYAGRLDGFATVLVHSHNILTIDAKYNNVSKSKALEETRHPVYPGLSDPDHDVARENPGVTICSVGEVGGPVDCAGYPGAP